MCDKRCIKEISETLQDYIVYRIYHCKGNAAKFWSFRVTIFHELKLWNAIFLRHIDRLRSLSQRELYPWITRINRAQSSHTYLLPFPPPPPLQSPFSIRKFLSFGKFYILPVCRIVDISKCTSITRSPANENRETRQRKAIVEHFYSIAPLAHIRNRRWQKRRMKERYICASRDSMHITLEIKYLNTFFYPQRNTFTFYLYFSLFLGLI